MGEKREKKKNEAEVCRNVTETEKYCDGVCQIAVYLVLCHMSHSRRRIRIQNICRRIVFSILSRALRGKFERAEMRKSRQNIWRSIILPNSSVSDFINRSFVFSAVFFSFLLLFRVFGEIFRRSKTRTHGIFFPQPKPGGKINGIWWTRNENSFSPREISGIGLRNFASETSASTRS